MVTVKLVPCYSHGVPENDWKSRFDESCGELHQNFRADVRQMFGQSNISTSSATRCSNVSQVHQHISHAALKFPRIAWLFRQASSHPDYSHGLRGCCLALGTSRSVQKCQPLGQTWMARWHDGWCSNYSMILTALLKISNRSFVEKHMQMVFVWSWKSLPRAGPANLGISVISKDYQPPSRISQMYHDDSVCVFLVVFPPHSATNLGQWRRFAFWPFLSFRPLNFSSRNSWNWMDEEAPELWKLSYPHYGVHEF